MDDDYDDDDDDDDDDDNSSSIKRQKTEIRQTKKNQTVLTSSVMKGIFLKNKARSLVQC
jgi:hypothetical protein